MQIEITEYESLKSNTEIQYSREKYKNEIREIEKGNSLNTHEKYNMYVSKLKYSISNIEQNLDALIRAKFKDIVSNDVRLKIRNFGTIKDLSLKEKESLWKKYLKDDELDSKKEDLYKYVDEKIRNIDGIFYGAFSSIDPHVGSKRKQKESLNSTIGVLNREYDNVENKLSSIVNINDKISKIMNLLIEDVEVRISEWAPIDTYESIDAVFENFLQLNYLLDEHNTITNRIKNK